ncbi:TetR/AcrR family transcriptional regulator [Actinocorallia populi]|uniref:TetR/AcrR family transcriptional regulator n=1 Tax=Actinocorallia populi TaxID=2079200 RepID=UPI0013008596|nr:TetR/AcrR family transcriptional regulator [Actinocorallia populi]
MGDLETDHLLDLAMRLFADLGYDGTSTRLIADAAGIPVERVVELAGDKPQLYQAVVARTLEAEQRAVDEALGVFVPTRQGVIDLFDAMLDFYSAHPRFLTLWMHRWMGDAADVSGQEAYIRRLTRQLADAIREVVQPDVDAGHLVWTITWCTFGFLTSGNQPSAPEADPGYRTPHDPQTLTGFRSYLHALITHLTRPPAGATAL